jgi:hypothetical protein
MAAARWLHAAEGAQMRQGKPLIYQEVDGSAPWVAVFPSMAHAQDSAWEHDRGRQIDPAIITYSTYLAATSAFTTSFRFRRQRYAVG